MLTKPQYDAAMSFNHQLREIIQKIDGLASQAGGDGRPGRPVDREVAETGEPDGRLGGLVGPERDGRGECGGGMMAKPRRPTKDRIIEADERGSHWLHMANVSSERGNQELAERRYEKAQYWLDLSNRLRMNGDGS